MDPPRDGDKNRRGEDTLLLVLIVLGGLPGVGKTTIARELARAGAMVHVRIDSIEQALRNAGWKVDAEGYRAAQAVAEDNLRLGRTVIADCVNPWPLTRREWREVAERTGVRVLEVEIVCADAEEHRRRVESRSTDIPGLALPAWRDVESRDYRAWEGERLVIDTARVRVEESVRIILDAIGQG